MSARIIRIPARNTAAIFEMPGEADGSFSPGERVAAWRPASAFADAAWLSQNLSLPVRSYERHFARLNAERRR